MACRRIVKDVDHRDTALPKMLAGQDDVAVDLESALSGLVDDFRECGFSQSFLKKGGCGLGRDVGGEKVSNEERDVVRLSTDLDSFPGAMITANDHLSFRRVG